jgi:hypothetical protein
LIYGALAVAWAGGAAVRLALDQTAHGGRDVLIAGVFAVLFCWFGSDRVRRTALAQAEQRAARKTARAARRRDRSTRVSRRPGVIAPRPPAKPGVAN